MGQSSYGTLMCKSRSETRQKKEALKQKYSAKVNHLQNVRNRELELRELVIPSEIEEYKAALYLIKGDMKRLIKTWLRM